MIAMRSASIAALVALGAGLASASSSSSSNQCNGLNITSANPSTGGCSTIDGDVIVDQSLSGSLTLSGVTQIKGDLIINNATLLTSFTASDLQTIDGKFELVALNLLSNLQMENLQSVTEIYFEKLTQLSQITFGSKGVSKAQNITITDTFLSTLDGMDIAEVGTFEVYSNAQLNSFTSALVNVTDSLIFSTNGASMTINMSMLEMAQSIQLREMKSFTAPALKEVGSLSFNSNPELQSFTADNLTEIAQSLTFADNEALTNFSFASLKQIAGDLYLVNNTKLTAIDGMPQLDSVYGGIQIAGNFQNVSIPKLNHVSGTVDVNTTSDSSSFCSFWNNLKSQGIISGLESCDYQMSSASGHGSGSSSSGSGSSSSSSGSGKKNDASGLVPSINGAILGLTAVAAVAQLL